MCVERIGGWGRLFGKRQAVLEGTRLRRSVLEGARLNKPALEGARLRRSVLDGARMRTSVLEGARLTDYDNVQIMMPLYLFLTLMFRICGCVRWHVYLFDRLFICVRVCWCLFVCACLFETAMQVSDISSMNSKELN